MSYEYFISWVMTVLSSELDFGISASNIVFRLDEKGFYFIKNGTTEEKEYFKASNIVELLFNRDVTLNGSKIPIIYYLMNILEQEDIKNTISFSEVFGLISKIQNISSNITPENKIIEFDFCILKSKLSKIKKDDYVSFKN